MITLAIVTLLFCASCLHAPLRPKLSQDFEAFIAAGNHHNTLRNFERYLRAHRVQNVVPTEQLLRQGTDWRRNKLPQYAFPPTALWPRITDTLWLLRRFIIPVTGPVKVVSGFRTVKYNRAAGGATRSQHLEFSALDIKPVSDISRADLHYRLLHTWQVHGKALNMGLGLYKNRRFHIDTGGYRKW